MKNTQNADSTSTSTNGAPEANKATGSETEAKQVTETIMATKSLLPSFPTVVSESAGEVITYGSQVFTFPIGNNGETATIDQSLLSGKGTKRLLNIKQALKVAGRTNDPDNRKWFNTEVRDVWHKVLKFAARDSLANGKPVSLGLSTRTSKKTGQVTMTAKHGFEHVITPPTVKAVEDKAAKQSATRAKRQNRKAGKRISPLPNPVIAPAANVSTPEPAKA